MNDSIELFLYVLRFTVQQNYAQKVTCHPFLLSIPLLSCLLHNNVTQDFQKYKISFRTRLVPWETLKLQSNFEIIYTSKCFLFQLPNLSLTLRLNLCFYMFFGQKLQFLMGCFYNLRIPSKNESSEWSKVPFLFIVTD